MSNLKIIPIRVGTISHYRGEFSGEARRVEREGFPLTIFYIAGGEKKVLVDTGGGIPGSPSQTRFHGPYERQPEEEPAAALKAATGLDPKDIDIVIITHLHWDHCCNNHLFPQADFYVQRSEMIATIDPIPRFRNTYEAFSLGVIPPWAQQATKWKIVDGEANVIDGIRLIPVPGHSKGIQGVLVQTAKGPYFLASDAIPLYDNMATEPWTPSPMHLDLESYYASLAKIQALGATVIPSHDAAVFKHKSYPADSGPFNAVG
jgi:glyoxylase-like metal-dependent hydrolase (beta-lactamase superfamily II)